MKAKNTLVLQTIGMYVMHLPLYALIIINAFPINTDLQNSLTMPLLIAALVLMVCILPICIINVITSFKSVLNEETELIKTTMVIKLCLIPWYVLNFLIGFVFVSIFFNPFMMIAIPIIIVFLVSSTYLIMLTTSFGDIAYIVHNFLKNDLVVKPIMIFTAIFLFIFCLDVIGAIMLYKKTIKVSNK